MPPDAWLGDAPHLQALYEPTPALRLVPRHILQRTHPRGLGARLRALGGLGGGAVLVHVALGSLFLFLLSFRDAEVPREVEIPVEVVAEPSKAAGAGAGGTTAKAELSPGAGPRRPAPSKGDPAADPAKSEPAVRAAAPTPPAPTPPTAQPAPARRAADAAAAPAPTQAQMPRPASPPAAAPPAKPVPPRAAPATDSAASQLSADVAQPPKLVAPPPEAARSATQAKENKPANLVRDEGQADQATREAKPAAAPNVLTTADAAALASVPAPSRAKAPADRPTPPTVARAPSQADMLAAALPMGASAMPMGFRSMAAGNAAAQINAAYGGVVQGRVRQAAAELSAAAAAQRLSGAVALTFTIDDAGGLSSLRVAQSSGSAELDALALHAIEAAAPFPPPPPEAEHTFNKAFLVGG